MFHVTASFSPIRIIVGNNDSVLMNVYIKNKDADSKVASLIVKIPFSLGFDRSGLSRETRRRIGYVKPDSEKTVPIMLYPKSTIQEGEHKIEVRVFEHKDRYDRFDKEYVFNTALRVIGR
jgi:uncharacterized membrane protein